MNGKDRLDGNKTQTSSVQNMTYWFSLREARKTNLLVTGTNATGKSLTAMNISDKLIRDKWQVIVFDNVGIWKEKSSVPFYFEVSPKTLKYVLPKTSIIFDTSLLLPSYQREFTDNVLMEIWDRKVTSKSQTWQMIILEESHLYMRNIRGDVSQNLMRIASVGRNHKIRMLAISPTLTGIDKEFVRLSSQRYHFKLAPEQHSLRRFRSYYGKDWQIVARELDTGFCIYYLNEKLSIVKIPVFISKIKPRNIVEIQRKPKEKGIFQRVISAVFGEFPENSGYYDQSEDIEDSEGDGLMTLDEDDILFPPEG